MSSFLVSFKKYAVASLFLALSVSVVTVYAQPAQVQAPDQSQIKVVTVANMDLVDVSVTEKGTAISGVFALKNHMGQQNDIVYGIVVYNSKGAAVDVKKLGEVPFLKEDELKRFNFNYTIPSHVSGSIQVALVVETKSGLSLGRRDLMTKEIPKVTGSLTCSSTESTILCVLTKDVTVALTYQKTLMSDVLLTESKDLKAGESVSLIGATLKPGSYSVFITNTASGERVIASLSIKGQYADIENVAIYKNEDGKTASTITVLANSYKNKNMSITLKGSDGVICISQDKPLNEPVVSFDNLATCSQGTAVITIKDVQGIVLATMTQSFDVQPIRVVASILQGKDMAAFRKECLYQLVGGIFGILAVIAFVVILRRRAAGTLVIALFLLYVLTGTYQTHALSQWAYLMDTAMGEFSWQCRTTTTVDKSSYAPGETVLVTTAARLSSDTAATGDDGGCYVYYYNNVFNTAPAYDSESSGIPVNYLDTGARPRVPKTTRATSTFSFVVPMTMLTGNHTVKFIETAVGGGTSGSAGGDFVVNGPLPFTVGAAAPVVQIYLTP